jgi:hypothetical protein
MYLSCKYIGIRKWVKLLRGPKRINVSILLTGRKDLCFLGLQCFTMFIDLMIFLDLSFMRFI